MQYDDFDLQSWPMGQLTQRIRSIGPLEAQYQAEIDRVIADVWDVADLHARIDQVGVVLHSTTRTDQSVVDDVGSYDAYVDGVKASIAARAQ